MQKFVITEGENMTEKTLNNNQVVVAGEIATEFVFSHEIFGEGFYMVDLIVSRLSELTILFRSWCLTDCSM